MTVGLDTSVVLRLITGEPEVLARLALDVVEDLLVAGEAVIISDLVASETYFALQHHFQMPKAEALAAMAQLLHESGIRSMGAAGQVLATPNLATASPGFVDRLIHSEYARLADQMLTFERASKRLARVRVLAAR